MLQKREEIFKKISQREYSSAVTSINDLKEKEFSGKKLSDPERIALSNFDKFRISELNATTDDNSFHNRYRELQVIANLGDFREFLDDKYARL